MTDPSKPAPEQAEDAGDYQYDEVHVADDGSRGAPGESVKPSATPPPEPEPTD